MRHRVTSASGLRLPFASEQRYDASDDQAKDAGRDRTGEQRRPKPGHAGDLGTVERHIGGVGRDKRLYRFWVTGAG